MGDKQTRIQFHEIEVGDRIRHPDIPDVVGEVDRIVLKMERGRPADGKVTVFYEPNTQETYTLSGFDAIGFTRA